MQDSTEKPESKRNSQKDNHPHANSTTTNISRDNRLKMKNYLRTATLVALIGNGALTVWILYTFVPRIFGLLRGTVEAGTEFVMLALANIFSATGTFIFFLVLYLAQLNRNKRN